MTQPTEQTARQLNQLSEIELDAKVGSSIHMCITDERNVIILMTGQVPDMVTMIGACLFNLHKQLTEQKIIPKMNYFKFILWVYKQSIEQASKHVKKSQAKGKASKASDSSGTDKKTS
mgnify:FL=1